jgi:hypothetical protein
MRRNSPYLIIRVLIPFALLYANSINATDRFVESDFQRQFPQPQLVTLNSEPAFMALSLPRLTGYAKGSVILISDHNEHAASPKYIQYLRVHLTELGWNTLSIMPPAIAHFNPNKLSNYQQQLKQRIATAMNHINADDGAIVIIAQGSSAGIINQLYAEQQLTTATALIMLGAYLPDYALNQQLAQAIASHAVPTLDISNSFDNSLALSQLKQRQQLANKSFKASYRQRLITGSAYNASNQSWVLQEIYGWLVFIGL